MDSLSPATDGPAIGSGLDLEDAVEYLPEAAMDGGREYSEERSGHLPRLVEEIESKHGEGSRSTIGGVNAVGVDTPEFSLLRTGWAG